MTALALTLLAIVPSTAPAAEWREIAPDVWQWSSQPAAYVLVDRKLALAIGAPHELDLASLEGKQACRVESVLLTHYHRDSSAAAGRLIREHRNVRAPRASEPWLSPEGVRRYWNDSLPEVLADGAPPLSHRRWAKWQYLVPGEGIEGLACDVESGDVITCGKWRVTAVATPGHSPDHTVYLATHEDRKDRIVLCGDAFHREGKLWTPYTTDWHHQNADGLAASAASLRRIAALDATLLCPEHGEPISEKIDALLSSTALAIGRAADDKGYDTFLRRRNLAAPRIDFLAAGQVGTATPEGNSKPWTKISPHLFLSGNTYAIGSRDGPLLLVDPYHRGLVSRLEELRREHGVGPVEGMLISHAHNDHYTGVFAFAQEHRPPVWTLDRIADVIESPDRHRAPYVDPRAVKVARRLKDGETISWREYRLRIHHQPGQTEFAMGVESTIDDHRVLFTGDNFYRADQYSGSGGWSGHNRGLPSGYARSIEKILELKPDWIAAEHGGAMAFSPSDFVLRLDWARESAAAANALSPSGDHRRDWNPHLVTVEPAILRTLAGAACRLELVASEPIAPGQKLWVRFAPNSLLEPILEDTTFTLAGGRAEFTVTIRATAPPGRNVVPVEIGVVDSPALPLDCVLVVIVRPR